MEIQWDFDTDVKTDGNLIVPVENDIKIDPKEFGLSIIPVAANKKPIIKSWSEKLWNKSNILSNMRKDES